MDLPEAHKCIRQSKDYHAKEYHVKNFHAKNYHAKDYHAVRKTLIKAFSNAKNLQLQYITNLVICQLQRTRMLFFYDVRLPECSGGDVNNNELSRKKGYSMIWY